MFVSVVKTTGLGQGWVYDYAELCLRLSHIDIARTTLTELRVVGQLFISRYYDTYDC